MPNGTVCPEFPIQQPGQVLTAITRKSLTVWSRKMNNQKAERVANRIAIWNFRSFSLAETQKFEFFPAAALSKTDSSSVVDTQNSIFSRQLVGWGCMRNG
jgi:hypothetical protein